MTTTAVIKRAVAVAVAGTATVLASDALVAAIVRRHGNHFAEGLGQWNFEADKK